MSTVGLKVWWRETTYNSIIIIHTYSVPLNIMLFRLNIILCQQLKLFVSYKIEMSVSAITIHYPYCYFYLIYKMFQNYVIRKLWKGHFRIWKLCRYLKCHKYFYFICYCPLYNRVLYDVIIISYFSI